MNSRGGYQFFPSHGPPNPFLSFAPGAPRPPQPFHHPFPSPNPFPFGFPPMPQDIDPSRLPVAPNLLQPQPNDAFQNFLQASYLAHPQAVPPPMPLTVRSGVYDLRAVEAHMTNSLKEGSIVESPQPLSTQPPPRGHFSGPENNNNNNNNPTSSSPTPAGSSGVVSDDPTTYWLGDSNNEFTVRPSNGPSSRSSARARRNNKQNNINNNTNITSTSTTTNGTTEGEVDNHEDITATGHPANNGRNGRNKHPFSGPASSTSTSGDFNNNQRNGKRQIHTNNRNTTTATTTKRYVPKPNDVTFKTLQIDMNAQDTGMNVLAKALSQATVADTDKNTLPEGSSLSNLVLTATSSVTNENNNTGNTTTTTTTTTTTAISHPGSPNLDVEVASTTVEENSEQGTMKIRSKPPMRFALPRAELIELISVDCRMVFESLQPPLTDLHAKIAFLSRLQRMVEGAWPTHNPKLHMFGSSANEMCFVNGDIDMCLTIDKGAGPEKNVVNKLSNMLEKRGMNNVKALPHARVPIVKFKDPKSRFMCDICINNSLALQNTRLVADYSKIDPRVRPLAYLVKYWAKRRGINNPYQGTLSSYAYINLVLNFLQTRDPPILPSLQSLAANVPERFIVDKFDCTYADPTPYIGSGAANTQSMAELLCHFFHYYTNEFDARAGVVSVRCGTVLSKKEKGWDSVRLHRDNMLLAIEDPFETTHNLGRLVDKEGLHSIMSELRRACILLRNEGSFVSVCKERGVV